MLPSNKCAPNEWNVLGVCVRDFAVALAILEHVKYLARLHFSAYIWGRFFKTTKESEAKRRKPTYWGGEFDVASEDGDRQFQELYRMKSRCFSSHCTWFFSLELQKYLRIDCISNVFAGWLFALFRHILCFSLKILRIIFHYACNKSLNEIQYEIVDKCSTAVCNDEGKCAYIQIEWLKLCLNQIQSFGVSGRRSGWKSHFN